MQRMLFADDHRMERGRAGTNNLAGAVVSQQFATIRQRSDDGAMRTPRGVPDLRNMACGCLARSVGCTCLIPMGSLPGGTAKQQAQSGHCE